LHRLFDLL